MSTLEEDSMTQLSSREIAEAIRLADKVRQVPARMALESALARVSGSGPATVDCGCNPPTDGVGSDPGCGC